jgi:nucleoside-diphosphate-sugar epimerase
MDLDGDRVGHLVGDRFRFLEGDVAINHEWIEYHVKKCDVVLPLVAIATPMSYVREPLRVFELDFEQNLRIVRHAVAYGTRLVFPSTSEVYGMCPDRILSEDGSPLVLGPIHKQRWIYAASKQLLDRVIYAYGQERKLRFTLFRPFNWIGPRLDNISSALEGSSRVVTQFLGNLMRGEPIRLVEGGAQRRCITYISDGIDALMRILADTRGGSDGRILNLGNPDNDCSIRELAELLVDLLEEFPGWGYLRETAVLEKVSSEEYYGSAYQDIQSRVPDIAKAREILGWEPVVGLREALRRTVAYYAERGESPRAPDAV